MEEWRVIQDYPAYEVSNTGFVRSIRSHNILKPQEAKGGAWFVKLGGTNGTTSKTLKTLVAEAFVPRPEHHDIEIFDTPIQCVMNTADVRAEKIMWRPRWFAIKFRRDLNHPPHYCEIPVQNLNTGNQHASIFTASLYDGVLMEAIYRSCLEGRKVFPEGHMYEFLRLGV